MREIFHAMLVLVAVLFFGPAGFCSGRNTSFSCIEREREALLKLKLCFHDPSNMLSSWKGNDCCEWRGVGCDKNSSHVVSLQLKGSIFDQPQLYLIDNVVKAVSSLLKLKYLEHLDLSGNYFNNSLIPPSFGLMKQLRYLNLSNVYFRGRIPGELGNLTRLRVLDLSNCFGGVLEVDDDIPWISRLLSMQQLDMSGVNLKHVSSNLFQVLCMLPSLSWLSLSRCSLKNSHLPPPNHSLNFTFFGNIQYFDLSENLFQGPIPVFLQNMTSLTFLDLSSNYFDGNITDVLLLSILKNMCGLKSLYLSSNKFEGEMLGVLGNSSGCLGYELETMYLGGNQISGLMPNWLGELKMLRYLDLSINKFVGPIPSPLGTISTLRELDLSKNKLNGTIPMWKSLTIQKLYLSENQLSGSIPNSIGQLSKLKYIHLAYNQLSGNILDSIGQLSKLEYLSFSSNKLNGVIPNSIGKLFNLKTLDVEYNSLEGVISEAHFANLSKLIDVSIGFNNLNCEMKSDWRPPFHLEYISMESCKFGTGFPKWLQLQKTAFSIDLSNASISGALPENIGHILPNLGYLVLMDNLINGSIPKSLCNLKALAFLDLSNNMLSGNIPDCWTNDQAFYIIDLSYNNLSGLFPSTMQQLSSLFVLHLNNNSLHGELHVALKNFTSLVVLDLGDNKFHGNLTRIGEGEISNHSLKVLRLRKNLFSSYIPSKLCSLSQLQILDLANNNLKGRIPPCFGKFPIMMNATQLIHDMDDTYWSWVHLMEVVKGRFLEYTKKPLGLQSSIDLSSNNLVGSIPEELVSLKELHNLNLSWNHLLGKVPENIGQMENLESLDFSQNDLSGTIPKSLSRLTKLSHLNLSSNNLSGPIPTGNQLQTLEDPTTIYANNPQLCGAPLLKNCSDDWLSPTTITSKDNNEDAIEKMWFYIVVMSGFAIGFWGVVGTLVFMKSWRCTYFHLVDDVKDWVLVIITLKVVQFKKRFSGNPNDQ